MSCPSIPPPFPASASLPGSSCGCNRKENGNYAQLGAVVKQVLTKARTRPELVGVSATINPASQQLLAQVDRDKAVILGIPVQDIYNTLQTLFGSLYVSQFPKNSRLWQVIIQAEPKYRMTPENINQIYVRNGEGKGWSLFPPWSRPNT